MSLFSHSLRVKGRACRGSLITANPQSPPPLPDLLSRLCRTAEPRRIPFPCEPYQTQVPSGSGLRVSLSLHFSQHYLETRYGKIAVMRQTCPQLQFLHQHET